jgi:hypothetical protein
VLCLELHACSIEAIKCKCLAIFLVRMACLQAALRSSLEQQVSRGAITQPPAIRQAPLVEISFSRHG